MIAILFLRYFATYISVSFMHCSNSVTLKIFTYSSAITDQNYFLLHEKN